MSLHRLTRSIRQLFSRKARRQQEKARRQVAARLELVALESRETPATLTTGTVSGLAFVDANNNRLREANEPGLAGASLTLVGTADNGRAVRANVSSGGQGGYRFLNVPSGSYQLIANPSGGFSAFGANAPVLLFQGRVNGGKTTGTNVAYRPTSTSTVSLNQFLNTSTVVAVQANTTPGAGSVQVGRPNHAPEVIATPRDITANKNGDQTIDLKSIFTDPDLNSRVRITTNVGVINLDLYDNQANLTVRNFINYITSNRYDNAIFHRLDSVFHGANSPDVLQGGQFAFRSTGGVSRLDEVRTDAAVRDEVLIPNTPGTISMAKTGDPNSATSQFFFNLQDNTDGLSAPPQKNGGFTAFGKVDPASLPVLNALASLRTVDLSGNTSLSTLLRGLTDLPLRPTANQNNFPNNTVANDFALISDVQVLRRPRANSEALKYTVVGNTNTALVTPRLDKGKLTLDYATNATGSGRVTVRATDRFGAFTDTTLNLTVANSAPSVTVTLQPETATTNSKLTATAVVTDADKDNTTLTYVWKKNGVPIGAPKVTTALTDTFDLAVAGNGDRGDVITVEVAATDGTLASAAVGASRTVLDAPPSISLLTFNPNAPGTNDSLTVTVSGAADPDGDAVEFTYTWRVNNVVVKSLANSPSLTDELNLSLLNNGDNGQTVSVTVTPISGPANARLSGAPLSDQRVIV